ncbi:hypothetical protein [Mycobacterium sp. E740]|uniref:hypothetical protein n=1 Tax=Mycobacterium sp. E740 TaxID=1834149 RepID=UPI00080163F5|nr:hypothetical protein [Mycobacterium sp. E740]OBI75106.1 hypothetical protein A5663_04495 [Mycobacterium sp. E740]
MFDVQMLLEVYLCGWVLVTLGLFVAGTQFADVAFPAQHPLRVAFVGGAVWPLLLLGVAELGSVALYAKMHSHR